MRTQKEIKKGMDDLWHIADKAGRGVKYDDVQVELLMDIRNLLIDIKKGLSKK